MLMLRPTEGRWCNRTVAVFCLAGADLTGQVTVGIRQVVGSSPAGAGSELLPSSDGGGSFKDKRIGI